VPAVTAQVTTPTPTPTSSAIAPPTPLATTCVTRPLGVATDFNAFTFGNGNFSGGLEGRAAFGVDATLSGVGIATTISSTPISNVLVVGGTLTASNASANNGNVVVGVGRIVSGAGCRWMSRHC
jgi:hypothetical protein